MPINVEDLSRVIREEFDRHEDGCKLMLAQVDERLSSLDDRLKSFDKIILTGNGQPSIISQLAALHSRFESLAKEVAESAESRNKLAPALASQLVTLQAEVKELGEKLQEAKSVHEKKSLTKTQFILAWMGIFGAMLGGAGSVFAAIYQHYYK